MRTMFAVTALLVTVALGSAAETHDSLTLWYSKPAAKWLEALPIGNASLGGKIFGGTTNERVQFNEQTLWLGSETEIGGQQPTAKHGLKN